MRDKVTIESCGLTDVGRQRKTNEDQFLVASLNKGMLVQQTSLQMMAGHLCCPYPSPEHHPPLRQQGIRSGDGRRILSTEARATAQEDPLLELKKEAHGLYEQLIVEIRESTRAQLLDLLPDEG